MSKLEVTELTKEVYEKYSKAWEILAERNKK
jgi:hypothetical protein